MGSEQKYQKLGWDYHWRPEWRNGAYGDWVRRVLAHLPEIERGEAGEIPGITVLDAGCGDGYPASLMVAQGYLVYGVDVVEEALAVAQEKVATAFFSSEWPEHPVDVVVALESIEHMTDLKPLVAAVQQCRQYALVSCPPPGMDPYAVDGAAYGHEELAGLFGWCAVEHLIEEGEHQLYKITPERESKPGKRGRGRPRITPEDRGQHTLPEGEDADSDHQ